MMKTARVSTNLTIFLKIVFPIIWLVFFGTFTLAVWFSGESHYGTYSAEQLKMAMPIFVLCGLAFMYWAILRLKRVEMDEQFVYVTNYFKTVRYPYHQIEKVVEKDYSLFKTVHIHLKNKGQFGKKISFIASRNRFQHFLNNHPKVVEQLALLH